MATQTSTLQQGNIFGAKPPAATTASATPSQSIERTRPYKDFLTPALHRRFSQAALIALGACYIEALLIFPPRLLWFWNPISFHGARALVLFMSCLMVFIVRVANLHIGERITCSGAETVYQMLTSPRTLHTLGWYVLSAFVFGEVYLWSRDESANLGWVDHGRPYERARVNENPLFLRAVWFCIALAQAGLHLARGEDKIAVPLNQRKSPRMAHETPSSTRNVLLQLQARAPDMLRRSLVLALPGFVATLVLYFTIIRRLIWPFFYNMAQVFYSDLSTDPSATGVQIDRVPQLAWQAFTSSLMLAALWELSNASFSIYVSESPTRRDEPLTSEVKDSAGVVLTKSKDPNGSLLNGLQSKKDMPKAFALWELATICSQFPSRRKTIYIEVDRKGGSTWAQVSKVCLDELNAICTRIMTALEPDKAQKAQDEKQLLQQQQQGLIAAEPEQPLGLPRIANRGVQNNGDIYQKQRPDLGHSVGSMAKSFGQSPGAQNPLLPRARRAIEWGADRTLSASDRERLSRHGLQQSANGTLSRLLTSPIGEPIRQTFARRACAVIFGIPNSDRVNIVHASQTLAALCTNAIKEDDYGSVAKSARVILMTYTKTINDINAFLVTLKPASSDVLFTERDRSVPEVEEVKEVLKEGLEAVLLAYAEYADSVGFTKTELRQAREALARGKEMVQR